MAKLTTYLGPVEVDDGFNGRRRVVHRCLDPQTGDVLGVWEGGWYVHAVGTDAAGFIAGPPVYATVRRPGAEWYGRLVTLTASTIVLLMEDGHRHFFHRYSEGTALPTRIEIHQPNREVA